MKMSIVFLILIVLLSSVFFYMLMRQNHNHQKLESEYESLQKRLTALEIQPQTGQDEQKTNLATQLAEANIKLINTDFSKFERELRNSNDKWLWSWTGFFVAIVAIVVTVIGFALWFSIKSMISDKVEDHLKGFQIVFDQVKELKNELRVLKREFAAKMLDEPHDIMEDDEVSEEGVYIYPDTIMSLSEQTLLDVLNFETYPIFTRIRAAEILKKRNPMQSLPMLLQMVNSFLDIDIYKDQDIVEDEYIVDMRWHLRGLVNLFKDMHTDETYRGLSKLLTRVLKIKDTNLKKLHLNWILFSLAYIGDALNTGKDISKMIDALPNLLITIEDTNEFQNLVEYFNKFQEPEGIREIYNIHAKGKMPDVEETCLNLLEKYDTDFVREEREEKASTNTEGKETNESKQTRHPNTTRRKPNPMQPL